MKSELQKQLLEKHSKIFVQRNLPPSQSLICFGIECGDGWFNLIDRLCAYLQWGTDKKGDPQVEAVQVKEKFGGLRFYIGGATKEQHEIIHFAEYLSNSICEWCGRPGKQEGGGWVITLCKDCKTSYDTGHRPWRDEEI